MTVAHTILITVQLRKKSNISVAARAHHTYMNPADKFASHHRHNKNTISLLYLVEHHIIQTSKKSHLNKRQVLFASAYEVMTKWEWVL
jgi:hypothetical protein